MRARGVGEGEGGRVEVVALTLLLLHCVAGVVYVEISVWMRLNEVLDVLNRCGHAFEGAKGRVRGVLVPSVGWV